MIFTGPREISQVWAATQFEDCKPLVNNGKVMKIEQKYLIE